MLVVVEGTVHNVRKLTDTGFCEVSFISDGKIQKASGNDLQIMREDEAIVIVAKEEIHKKYGPQSKIIRWWTKEKCPFADAKQVRETLQYLYDELKLPPGIAQRIFDAYLSSAKEVILDNPYRLATEGLAKRLGVKMVDQHLAPHFNISPTDKRRLKAQILNTMKMARSPQGIPIYQEDSTGEVYGFDGGGHVYVDFKQLACVSADYMELDRKTVFEQVRLMSKEPRNPLNNRPLITIEKKDDKDHYVYPFALHAAEKGLAFHIRRILDSPIEDLSGLPVVTYGTNTESQLILSDEQTIAIKTALAHPLSIITGGPGTGKTTIIRALTETLKKACVTFCLCAPTGVASRRISGTTKEPASTIHRLLKINPQHGAFEHSRNNPLGYQVIICDESSMVDISLMYSLFDAVMTGARVVMVGDADQLPPVGPGAPFRDMVAWGKIPTTVLTVVRRQELADSLIIQGSRKVLQSQFPEFSKDPAKGDLFVFPYEKEDGALKIVVDLASEKITKNFGIARKDIQILCPHRQMKKQKSKDGAEERITRILATENLNTVLQEKFFGKASPDQRFFEGDRVIHTKNNYELEVMNGEIGYVKKVSTQIRGMFDGTFQDVITADGDENTVLSDVGTPYEKTITGGFKGVIKPDGMLGTFTANGRPSFKARFTGTCNSTFKKTMYLVEYDHGRVVYDEKESTELELAYALSVHRAQGSEFQATIVLAYHSGKFYSRNLLYTAMTRGKRLVCIVSPKGATSLGKILSTGETKRASRLFERIENGGIKAEELQSLALDDLSDGDF